MKSRIILLTILLFSGCAFLRETKFTAGAKGAKSTVYGSLEAGEVLYEGKTVVKFGCK